MSTEDNDNPTPLESSFQGVETHECKNNTHKIDLTTLKYWYFFKLQFHTHYYAHLTESAKIHNHKNWFAHRIFQFHLCTLNNLGYSRVFFLLKEVH